MAASPWDGNWGLGAPPSTTSSASDWHTDPWSDYINNPWVNPNAGVYEGDGGDPRMAGNAQGIGDWKSIVNKVYGPGDPIALLQAQMKNGIMDGGVRRALQAAGLDDYTGSRIENLFTSGADAQQAAYQLGVFQQFEAGGQFGVRPHGANVDAFQRPFTTQTAPTGNPNYTGVYDPNWNSWGATSPPKNPFATPTDPNANTPLPPVGVNPFTGPTNDPTQRGGPLAPTAPRTPVTLRTPGATAPKQYNPFAKNPFGMPHASF